MCQTKTVLHPQDHWQVASISDRTIAFANVRCMEDAPVESFPDVAEGEEEQHKEGAQYPPDDPMLSRMVHYIFRKKIPADLPHDVISAMGDFPRHLIPHETICTECTGQTLLSEPQLITATAKIVTVTDIIQGSCLFLFVFSSHITI